MWSGYTNRISLITRSLSMSRKLSLSHSTKWVILLHGALPTILKIKPANKLMRDWSIILITIARVISISLSSSIGIFFSSIGSFTNLITSPCSYFYFCSWFNITIAKLTNLARPINSTTNLAITSNWTESWSNFPDIIRSGTLTSRSRSDHTRSTLVQLRLNFINVIAWNYRLIIYLI